MSSIEFKEWPKTPRLFRDMIVTEKIDGTNAAIIIEPQREVKYEDGIIFPDGSVSYAGHFVGAQSRKRLITPDADNFGFARWVHENAYDLIDALGPGRHFGEWWGSGIQRGYGLQNGEKRFSLFNVVRYADVDVPEIGLSTVPVLTRDRFDLDEVATQLGQLRLTGSVAAPGFMNPEGVVVFHEAAGAVFKATLENDAAPKGCRSIAAVETGSKTRWPTALRATVRR